MKYLTFFSYLVLLATVLGAIELALLSLGWRYIIECVLAASAITCICLSIVVVAIDIRRKIK